MQHSCKNTSSTCRYARTLHVKQEDEGGGLQDIGSLYRMENIPGFLLPSRADRPDDIIPKRAAWATEVGVACALTGT